jgi:hypothetical protein
MKGIKILVILLSIGSVSFAQRGLELTLKYNASSDKYEVYAKPNFTKRNLFLGPSQITVVLPASVANEKLRISNVDGGAWEDNSIIYSPASNAIRDYHGISTLGAKTDFVENNETLLFSFSLEKGINPSEVYLFENGKDPNSSASGMKGGDFSNSINDALAGDFYLRNYKEVQKKIVSPIENKADLLGLDDSNLVLYPNTTKDDFKVALSEVNDDELVTMIVTTELGKELIRVNITKKSLEEKTFKIPSEVSSQNLIVRVKTGKKQFGQKLLLNRE